MRVALISELGGVPRVGELPEPTLSPGQALVQVEAAALNPVDIAIASGNHYSRVPTPPYVPGSEGAGVVVRGERLPSGTRVRFEGQGALAELVAVEEDRCLEVSLESRLAAAFGIAGSAAWLALHLRAQLAPGERVLVLGATGVVGQVAVQLAHQSGAGRVVAAGRDPGRLRSTRDLGADATVLLDARTKEELAAAFIAAAEGELDVVLDPLWGMPLEAALLACRTGARVVNVGQSASPVAELPSRLVRGRQLTIIGHANPSTPWEARRQALMAVSELLAGGHLRLEVESLPLDDVAEGWRRLALSSHRKLVVLPAAGRTPTGEAPAEP
ncbi:MAG: quinone oxidoreductase family protein [Candidatus Dormibacteria bacterium]